MGTGRISAAMLAVLGIAAIGPSHAPTQAQDAFPTRTVRMVIPYPAGGGTDTIGRLVADLLGRKWGQTVVVENIGGAAGNVGAAQVFRAAPDGHTLMITSPGPVATNAFLYKDMPFDPPLWTSIALLATGPYVLVVSNNLGASTVKELVAHAKANPGKITAATPGVGSVGHLATVQLEMLAGITMTAVPYKGLSPAVNDIIAGHVDLMFDTPTTSLPLHQRRQGEDHRHRYARAGARISGDSDHRRDTARVPHRDLVRHGGAARHARRARRPHQPRRERDSRTQGRRQPGARHPDGSGHPVARRCHEFFAAETELWGKVIKQANITPQ